MPSILCCKWNFVCQLAKNVRKGLWWSSFIKNKGLQVVESVQRGPRDCRRHTSFWTTLNYLKHRKSGENCIQLVPKEFNFSTKKVPWAGLFRHAESCQFWSHIYGGTHHNWCRDMGLRVWRANRSAVTRMEDKRRAETETQKSLLADC